MDRRRLLTGAGLLVARAAVGGGLVGGGAAAGLAVGRARAQAVRQTLELRAPLGPAGTYTYLPFEVPPGVVRIDGRVVDAGGATTGVGLFDQRGPAYQSPGFRGVLGGELAEFSVAWDRASRAFLPGPVEPGTWTVVIPVFQPGPDPTAEVVVAITLHLGVPPAAHVSGPTPAVADPRPGWYRGDLHCHTPESSDAWSSGTAMTTRQWAVECRRVGLDFASMTDHNVVSQNLALVADAAEAGGGVLLIGGEEMTNWFHGHATVTGMDPGEWVDWRQRPQGVVLQDHEARITEFVRITREMGAFTSAAHPFGPGVGLPWTFLAEGIADPDALPDGIEVWTGDFQPDDEVALQAWDGLLQAGRRVTANGGSDLHGVVNDLQPAGAGTPTTVVYAAELSPDAIVAACRAGRCFITRAPNGGELYLTASGPGGQRTYTGGTVVGAPTDVVEVEVLVRRGALLADAPALRLLLIRDGVVVQTAPITRQEQVVGLSLPIGLGGYVRAELRGTPFVDPARPTASRLDMEALTNPIWLATSGEGVDEVAPPPSGRGRRLRDHLDAVDVAPLAAAPLVVRRRGAGERKGRDAPTTTPLHEGGEEPQRMALTSVVWHAACDTALVGRVVRLTGLGACEPDGRVTLTRWVADCCARDGRPVQVRLEGLDGAGAEGWVTVDARWRPGTGVGFAGHSVLDVVALHPAETTERLEG